ncbi:MAG TPA: metal ABC transporter substrate-binding protein [Actinomycetota bacterium]|nr:metal ABC transporter substrate-binding protein [Actinomycetota bacterium]
MTLVSRFTATLGTLVLLAACGGASPSRAEFGDDPGRLQVVTTVAPITSIASNVLGDAVDITGVVPEGTNSHTFEPSPSVAEVLSTADVVFLNGLVLEEPTKKLAADNLKDGAEIVELGALAISEDEYLYDFSFPREGGKPNPHLWTDPTLVRRYAEIIRDEASERDPGNAADYAANYEAFSTRIDELDRAMRASFATVPREDRKLLTYHDAYAYFARTYDWTVIGAIQVSDFEDPTPREVADLIDQVRTQNVKAIFGSEVFPSPVLAQIGRETGVRYVDVLRDDDLPGEPGDPEHSWLGLMRFDYVTMVESLGGDATALKALDVSDVAPDEAEYPQ